MNAAADFDHSSASLGEAIRHALRPAIFLRSFSVAAIIWLIMASLTPSFARLIFNGALAGYFVAGLGIALVSEIGVALLTSLLSSDHSTLACPQSPTAVIQGMIAASVAAVAPADMSVETLFAAIFWILVFSGLITGGVLLLLGLLRAGEFVRYIPYPIVGGYMAGFGFLLLQAGFVIVVDLRVNAETLPLLLDGALFMRWLPAILFALAIIALQSRIKSVLIMPGVIVASVILFYMAVTLAGASADSLLESGWLLPRVPNRIGWQLPDPGALSHITADMALASVGGVLTLVVICVINLFFRVSGQELVVERELDMNRECGVNGISNLAASAMGGSVVGYPAVAFSAFVQILGAHGRLVGIMLALMFGLTMLLGGALFAIVPRFLPAGLLMCIGMRFIKEWLLESRGKLPRQDYLIVLVIALATALFGLLAGIGAGIVAAVSFFVLEYSRMDIIKQEFTASAHRSNLDRSFAQNQFLRAHGASVLILRLQGFVFFGTAYRFYHHARQHILADTGAPLTHLILDFKAVSGFDFSTVVDFQKLRKQCDSRGIELLISDALPEMRAALIYGEVAQPRPGKPALFKDLDHALEWCENALLRAGGLLESAQVSVEEQLAQRSMLSARDWHALRSCLERIETQAGDRIFAQGDPSDALYFIESGRVDVLLHTDAGEELRLRSMTAGTVVGEVGFYLGKPRTASVVATEAGAMQRLSQDALRQLEERDAPTAAAVHEFIARTLSDRLSTTNQFIQQLMA